MQIVRTIVWVLLLVALYCGIPAANEAHRAAVEVLKEEQKT